MSWDIGFISKEDFYEHVRHTIEAYRSGMSAYDLEQFNSNMVDPIKLLLDKSIHHKSWETIIADEIFRQRDKGNNNSIGYFHQNIFSYIAKCEVPTAGWDVIYRNPEKGIDVGDGNIVSTVYVEMKNKHNTMNSASAAKTYSKAQKQILEDDNCACLLVEAIAKRSQNIVWSVSVDGKRRSHKLIRRVSMDKFYEIVTGDPCGFYKVCKALPAAIDSSLADLENTPTAKDTAYDELVELSQELDGDFTSALYLLGFSGYQGFSSVDFKNISI